MIFMDEKNNVVNTGHARTCTGTQVQATQTSLFGGEHDRTTCKFQVQSNSLHGQHWQMFDCGRAWCSNLLWRWGGNLEQVAMRICMVTQGMQERKRGTNAPGLLLLLPCRDQIIQH